ncbi:cell surface glycoprotein CD200 receptor 1 isoform X2 [Paroedura picta]|uniref:cell surface glycoprotein CD200 receptor 1 isoform X2 n=1 Tax=Paroedura picta TaxID=143630 RepID=UPI004056B3A4
MISDIHFVMKTWSARILLTVTVITVPVARGSIQNDSVQHLVSNSATAVSVAKPATQPTTGKTSIFAVVGTSVILVYPFQTQKTLLTVWNVDLINGTQCHVSYLSTKNISDTNCSENINWLSRPDQDYALLIKTVQIFNEGLYKCSISPDRGIAIHEYTLTVLVPPQVFLTYGSNRTAVCVAAAGKPAAQISWGPKRDFSLVNETLPNGTKTIISTCHITSAEENNLTCHISHPAWNNSRVLLLESGRNDQHLKASKMPLLYSIISLLLGIILVLLFIYLARLLYGKQKEADTSKHPETISRPSIQISSHLPDQWPMF